MARGFWTGLVHGSVLGAAGLLALSLTFPLSDSVNAPAEIPASEPVEAAPVAAEPVTEPAASDATWPARTRESMPAPGHVDLPVGSEFGRGGDIAPLLPAPLDPASNPMSQAEAPAVTAPPAEPAPIAITGENLRPETGRMGAAPDLVSPEPGGASPDLEMPSASGLSGLPKAPQMAEQAGQDALPSRSASGDQTAAPLADALLRPAAPDNGDASAPAMPAPMPDLSLPPDLSDLRTMERD